MPGSHRRTNTPDEERQLAEKRRVPLPESLQIKLNAGYGVVYSSMILHWSSNCSTKMRRVIHISYRLLGGQVYPYSAYFYWNLFTRHLSQAARAQLERFAQLSAEERDHIEIFFRAILAKDEVAFRAELALLHPGKTERIVCVMLLSRLATKIYALHTPEIASLPLSARAKAVGGQRTSIYIAEEIAGRFSTEEVELLRQRFAPLEASLDPEVEMPTDFGVDEFITSWDQHQ